MLRTIIISLLIILLRCPLSAGLLINEIACGTTGDDWVEIFFQSEKREELNISHLYVTMYYGSEEKLSDDPVTIYSYDRSETPYDDRFVVVHLTEPEKADETDLTGDANNNGSIDIYCDNYSSSLWNTDCVVAIDSDSNPSNGGIVDFVAYSNRDGSPNDTITSYVETAQGFNQWEAYSGKNIQECMVDIGEDGLSPYMSISRKNTSDHNSQDDFDITKYQTPGRTNLLSNSVINKKRLFKALKKKITMIPSHPTHGTGNIEIFVYEPCNIRFRIFSAIGMLIFESDLYMDIPPGNFSLQWDLKGRGRKACTGLYIVYIEATSSVFQKSDVERIFLILSQYR